MNLVYENRNNLDGYPSDNEAESVLKTWLLRNAKPTVKKFLECEKSNFKNPLNFSSMIIKEYKKV